MNRIWILVTCFVAFGWTSHEEYPVILWDISIIDEETLEPVKGVTMTREVYYDYVYCQHPVLSPFYDLSSIPSLMKEPDLTNEELEDYKNQYREAETELKLGLLPNKIPVTDTLLLDRSSVLGQRQPTMSYKVTISHPDYQSVALSKEYQYCEFYVYVCVELKRK